MSYYMRKFQELAEAGVPRWYIRLYALSDIICCNKIYIYYNPCDIESKYGWYATNGISIISTQADKNRKCYGELVNMGFPTWDEYKMLFDGDEYDCPSEFMNCYNNHKEEWLQERENERCTNYAKHGQDGLMVYGKPTLKQVEELKAAIPEIMQADKRSKIMKEYLCKDCDSIITKSHYDGGNNGWGNMVTCCASCGAELNRVPCDEDGVPFVFPKAVATIKGDDDLEEEIIIISIDDNYNITCSNGEDPGVGKNDSYDEAVEAIGLLWSQWETFSWIEG